jgi:cytochrome c-type biogenesis protein CcmF
VKIRAGETVELAGYAFRFDGVSRVAGPNYDAMQATIFVTQNGKPVTVMYPERRVYTVQEQVMTEAAIDPGITRDLYVSLGDPLDERGTWLLKVQHKPFVDWIWGGCLIMALGGLLAATDRRYRFAIRRKQEREAKVPA